MSTVSPINFPGGGGGGRFSCWITIPAQSQNGGFYVRNAIWRGKIKGRDLDRDLLKYSSKGSSREGSRVIKLSVSTERRRLSNRLNRRELSGPGTDIIFIRNSRPRPIFDSSPTPRPSLPSNHFPPRSSIKKGNPFFVTFVPERTCFLVVTRKSLENTVLFRVPLLFALHSPLIPRSSRLTNHGSAAFELMERILPGNLLKGTWDLQRWRGGRCFVYETRLETIRRIILDRKRLLIHRLYLIYSFWATKREKSEQDWNT